jgi:hypothetical protein
MLAMTMALGVACGGDGDDESADEQAQPTAARADPTAATSGDSDEEPTTSRDDDEDAASNGASVGDVSVAADPGQAVVEVDGRTILYESAGSSNYICDIESDRIQVNFQTADGHDLLIQGGVLNDEVTANITFTEGGDGPNQSHSATSPNDGELEVGADALRYEGTVTIVEDFDIETSRDAQAVIEVNCASAGGDATAEIDGETFVFQASGAQSYECEITDENTFTVRINRLSRDDLQLSFDGRPEGDGVIGNVNIISGDDNYTATLFGAEVEGLVIEGATITYTGTFEHTANGEPQGEVQGTATATCP